MKKTKREALILAAGLAAALMFSAAVQADNEKGPGVKQENSTAAAAEETKAAEQKPEWHRKSAEELQEVMRTVPAGPAKAEWGTFFLGNNLPPRNDEDETFLRSYHAYAMVPTE